jgi:hypothetical protein
MHYPFLLHVRQPLNSGKICQLCCVTHQFILQLGHFIPESLTIPEIFESIIM